MTSASWLVRSFFTALLCAILPAAATGCAFDTDGIDEEDEEGEGEIADSEDALRAERAGGAIGGQAFGLGVDAPAAVASPHYATLRERLTAGNAKLSTARTVFYLDGPHYDLDKLRAWVDGVKAGGMEPVVALSVIRKDAQGNDLPALPRSTYRARVATLLRAFPDVPYWGPVNEPDLDFDGDSAARAKKAVLYYVDAYRKLRACQAAKKCPGSVMLVAGEFSYQGGSPDSSVRFWDMYADEMAKRVKSRARPNAPIHRFPRIWSFHPYTDASSGKLGGTKRFDRFLDRIEDERNLPSRHLRGWITETGGILHLGDRCSTSAGNINGNTQKQYDGASTLFAMLRHPRFDRVYWWHWKQSPGHPWDSAMVDGNGVPRPAFCALTKQPLSACTGDPWATQCKP